MQQRAEQPSPELDRERDPVRTTRCGELVTAARPVPPADLPDPVRLLGDLEAPRSAWKRRDRWAVAAGSAAELRVAPDRPGSERFAALRRRAEELAGPAAGRQGGDAEAVRPRFYGGFSFHAAPDASGQWTEFPGARFRVPAREVRVGPDGAWLVGAAELGGADGDGTDAARRELRRLEERLDGLRGAPPGEPAGSARPGAPDARGAAPVSGAESLEREQWVEGVEQALSRIRDGRLEKVVLARAVDVPGDDAVDPIRACRRLRDGNPRSSVFFVQPTDGSVFLGASPELLGAARGSVFRATAVAGSLPRGETEEEDCALGRRLLASDKDRREQAIVAEEIRRCLTQRLRAVSVGEPRLLKLARIQHLESSVEGRLPDGGRGSHLLDLLSELHPTPAVCGRPREEALRLLRAAEGFERGWYAGPVGWFDPAGRGEFVPGLRSAVLRRDRWRLFAGAGIVEGSDPGREWEETGVKFVPMLRALGSGDPG